MSDIRGIVVQDGAVGASVENLDGCSALIINTPVVAASAGIAGVEQGVTYLFESVKDAEDRGINAAYDTANKVQTYRHITEFYRMAGEGTKLYFMAALETKDMAAMLADHGQAFINGANGEIRFLSVGYNASADYTPTKVNGLEDIVSAAIPAAQILADWAYTNDKPLHCIVEGRGVDLTTIASLQDLRDIKVDGVTISYDKVSVGIGQDWTYADGLEGENKKFADVGTLLGTRALIQCNYNIGEVGESTDSNPLDLSDTSQMIWLVAGLSDHSKVQDQFSILQQLEDKGYIFPLSYTGATGYRWSNDHVCAPIIVDAKGNMNVHTMAISATKNKLARLIRTEMLPYVKATVPLDTKTGKLPVGMVKHFEGIANQPFNQMLAAGELSGGQVTVDPDSDLLSGDKSLNIAWVFVPTGTVGEITGTLSIKQSL